MDVISPYDFRGNLKKKCAIPSFGPKKAACNILFYFRVFKLEPPYAV